MYWLRRLLLLLPGRRAARSRELHEELQANLSLAIEDAADPRIARRDFGSLTRAQEEARSVWFPGWDAVSQDVHFALRTLARAPVFTSVAVLSLALGIGAATALWALVDTVVLKPLAYREPGRLVAIREIVPPLAHIYPTVPVNGQHFRAWRDQASSFDSLAAISAGSITIYDRGQAEVIGSANVTPSLFEVLGVQPQLGRFFQKEDEQPGKNPPAVISDALWRRRFGGAKDVIGQPMYVGCGGCPVIGVLPAGFHFPKKEDLGPLTR